MQRTHGFTLLEVLLVVAIVGIVLGIAAVGLRALSDPVGKAASAVEGTFKQTRAKAMSTTSAYRISLASATTLQADYAYTCDDTTGWVRDPHFDLTLDDGVRITSPTALGPIVCFDSQGIANANPTVDVQGSDGKTAAIEVLVGGAVEVH